MDRLENRNLNNGLRKANYPTPKGQSENPFIIRDRDE